MTHGMVCSLLFSVCMCMDWCSAGTKNVAKELRTICAGGVRARDKTWFFELSDKGMFFDI